MMRIRTSSAGWLRPGWWQEPQRTILWRGVHLVVGRLAAWPLLVVGIVMLVYPSRTERRWARLSRGICPKCKYDLTGVQDRCPECGRELSADEAAALRARPRKDEGPR